MRAIPTPASALFMTVVVKSDDFIDVDDAKFANLVMPPYTRENFLDDLNRVTEGRIDQ